MEQFTSNDKKSMILIIDDEENLCRLTKRVLERKGYIATVAIDSKEGMEIFEQNRDCIDLVILDMYLPEISGLQILEMLLQKKADLKIILISGILETKEISEYLQNPNVSFLQKPYDNSTLLERIEAMRG